MYELSAAGTTGIAIYDLSGLQVRLRVRDVQPTGFGSVVWDGKRGDGSRAAAGAYLCVLRQGSAAVATSVTLVR